MESNEKFLHIFNCEKYLDMLELSDANLQTDDGCNFGVHRFTLALSSDYFNRMFLGMDRGRRQFHIPGISGECLSDILCCVYTGDTLRVGERNVADLIIGTDYLLLDDLRMKIKGNIEDYFSEVNCLRILLFAHRIGDGNIFRKCFRFVQTRFEGIVRRALDDLTDLPLDILRRILSKHSLCVRDETAVWQAIVAWTKKDIQLRTSCVPQLLPTLAVEDVGEELATEILQHEIISENCCLVRDSVEEIASSSSDESPTNTNLNVLSTLLRCCSNRLTEPILRHRIPLQLLASWSDDDGGAMMNLYATHDENTHLWRMMTELRLWPDGLVAIEHHDTSEFEAERTVGMNFDLGSMTCVRTERYKYSCIDFYFVTTDAHMYDLSNWGYRGVNGGMMYDIANGGSRYFELLHRISHLKAAVVGNKLYVVGKPENSDAMMTQMFDPDVELRFDPDTERQLNSQWSVLSPPTVCTDTEFSLVAHQRKIYLLGSSAAEVFFPAANQWKEIPGGSWKRSSPKAATVANDRIIVDDEKRDYVSWSDVEPCLEEFVRQIPSMESRLPGLPIQ